MFHERFEQWCISNNDEIRAKCATILIDLHKIDLIKSKANNLCSEMIATEKNDSVKRILELTPINKSYSANHLNNFRLDEEYLIYREDAIIKIKTEFKNNYLVSIVGFEGIGKTTTKSCLLMKLKIIIKWLGCLTLKVRRA